MPLRPPLGAIDGSRYDHWGNVLELGLARSASRRLTKVCEAHRAHTVHAVAHSPSFWPALHAARAVGARYMLTAHDDLRYLLRRTPMRRLALDRLADAWRAADERFVISQALGEEYCARYGRGNYEIVTDGLRDSDFLSPHTWNRPQLRCYFAGLFHRGYRANVIILLQALALLASRHPGFQPSLTCRCGTLPELPRSEVPLKVLEFGSEADVRADLTTADLLYLPLMLEPEFRDMTAFSLSTKLITYLGAGVPILYHGPADSAAGKLLAQNDAAIMATADHPEEVAEIILQGLARGPELVMNAHALAEREFLLEDQRSRFWSAVFPRPTAFV